MANKFGVTWVPKITGTKYKAKRVEIDGHKFDSKAEASHYLHLKHLEKAGKIANLELQPKFVLQESYMHNGAIIRPITYVADFRYLENGEEVVVDVKSKITEQNPVYRLKRKMLLFRYPYLNFKEIVK